MHDEYAEIYTICISVSSMLDMHIERDNMTGMQDFSDWLRGKFTAWQAQSSAPKTVVDWSIFLGVSQPNLSRWLNGKSKPDGINLERLADKLGLEVYDRLGLVRPNVDTRLNLINKAWDLLPESLKNEFAEKAGRVQEEKRDGQKAKARK